MNEGRNSTSNKLHDQSEHRITAYVRRVKWKKGRSVLKVISQNTNKKIIQYLKPTCQENIYQGMCQINFVYQISTGVKMKS